ncbi:MAG TPA: 2-polyprenyl-6-methoxyphenol hydroxylase-like oxidoreductase [Mycobacterium sp.]|nr:2-polyprenyl-6-methoxyphenol hydroxylase-like oxidoreductase [Mycobacterium sp.]HTY34845.1 2-polyprenyl-6-methoxyphenol hydroxylase-like oxidoreductase [Mycobacterium sp.]
MVERDVLPDDPANRRGVPQGRHGHALLGRGSQILAELFPGFLDELIAAGAPVLDFTDVSKAFFSFGGHQLISSGGFSDIAPVFIPSRPLVEGLVRRRLRETANVTVLEGYDFFDLTSTTARDRVTGARIRSRDGDDERVLTADLVADATGRGARTPAFLDALGYGRPTEDQVGVRVVYSSQLLRIRPGTLKELIVLVGAVPGRPTGMALFGYENDSWMFTVFGMAGRKPPSEPAEMLAFAEGLAPAHVLAAIGAAEPLSEVCRFRYPESRWRRYEKMPRFPAGLLVLGDAICSFNPIYGQGMTVAALEALALQRCLRRGEDGLARRYFRAAAKPIGVAWRFAVGGDLNLPEVEGPRPLSLRLTNRYVDRLQTAAESDIVVAEQFLKITGLIDQPTRLLHPKMMLRATTANLHRRQRDSQPEQAGVAGRADDCTPPSETATHSSPASTPTPTITATSGPH